MTRTIEEEMEFLQRIANRIDSDKYYSYEVEKKKDGFYLVPNEVRWFGDKGEWMGETFEHAKINISHFVLNLC